MRARRPLDADVPVPIPGGGTQLTKPRQPRWRGFRANSPSIRGPLRAGPTAEAFAAESTLRSRGRAPRGRRGRERALRSLRARSRARRRGLQRGDLRFTTPAGEGGVGAPHGQSGGSWSPVRRACASRGVEPLQARQRDVHVDDVVDVTFDKQAELTLPSHVARRPSTTVGVVALFAILMMAWSWKPTDCTR